MEIFQDYAYYYNSFYKDKNYQAEAETIDMLLKKYTDNLHITRLINFGCGTGRHDIELTKLGYCCNGIDFSPLMIEIACKNSTSANLDITFKIADIRNYVAEEKYDAVVSMFHVMSYQNSNEEILNTFISARNCLERGGLFIFDTWYGPGVLSDKPCVRVKEIEDDENRLLRIARPVLHDKNNTVEVKYEILVINKTTNNVKVIEETHNMRYFFRPELEMLLNQTGFKLLDQIDCQTLGQTDYISWTCYTIAQAY